MTSQPTAADDWAVTDCDEELLASSTRLSELLDGRTYHQMTPAEAREAYRKVAQARAATPGTIDVGSVVDRSLDVGGIDVPLRVYVPVGRGPWPVVVFFHGGGWIFGDIDTYDDTARWVCARSDVIVISVGYLLAPEHRFPAPLTSCLAAVRWAHENVLAFGGEADALVVMGDSAGGNLAAATALEAASHGIGLVGQVVLYAPLVHVDHTAEAGVSPWLRRRQRFGPTLASATWYWENYVGPSAVGRDPRASVLLQTNVLSAPPALVAYGELDTFGEECEAYARLLRDCGVPVTVTSFPRIGHGFLGHGPMPEGDRSAVAHAAASQVCADLGVLARTGRLP